ncbi:uncharacterized protein PRCAT00006281001 [Priceomyces carsonii]|uniref:uncharacterized protein n=1 Tax=Priceomyces carsonii TaxID=28549 RepID=UPI002EDB946A|nr:unnamed protein product [Priceomyces carsonii]
MISPKYSSTHYYHSVKTLANPPTAPNIVNLYLDHNCVFSAKLFLKLKSQVIPKLQEKHPNKFQFVYVNVVQPWHPNSTFLNEFSLVVAKLLREKASLDSNVKFWNVSEIIFSNKEHFFDTANVTLNRNEIYNQISDLVFDKIDLPFSKEDVLSELTFRPQKEISKQTNNGNGATVDLKYFTRYLRVVGIHITPTVSVNGIVNDSISSGSEPDELIKIFESLL